MKNPTNAGEKPVIFRRIFRLMADYPARSILALVLAIVCTSLIVAIPSVTKIFIDDVIGKQKRELLIPVGLAGLAAVFLRQLLFTLRGISNQLFEQKLVHRLRVELFQKLQRLPIAWFDQRSSGEVMSRVSSDVPAMESVIVLTLDQTLPAIFQFVLMASWMFYQSWVLTLVTLSPLPIIALLTRWHAKKSEPKWRASSEASADLSALLHDHLAGIRQIKAYTLEPESAEKFHQSSQRVIQRQWNVMKSQAVIWPSVSLLAESSILIMLGCGAWWTLNGTMQAGVPISFLVAWGFLFDPIARINNLSQQYVTGKVAAQRVFELIDQPDEIQLEDGLRPAQVAGEIEFRDVSFTYEGEANHPVLHEISLVAQPGQTIALVGETGSGKSTMLHLLARFYEPNRGGIFLDGTPYAELSKEWLRDHIAYVTQDAFLFNASLRENLQIAQPDASDEQLWLALEQACAKEFVEKLPQGLDTLAGERGVRFSGGEKQRLSIARALLKNTPLLLLDEATSALDNQTEKLVQKALYHLRQRRTTFVIAHRLTTVQEADCILVLDAGKIIEFGTHEQLLTQGGRYAQLLRSQITPAREA